MFFSIVNAVLAHPAGNGVPPHAHLHLWQVSIIVGFLSCVLLVAGVYIMDLRKAAREKDERLAKLERDLASRKRAAASLEHGLSILAKDFQATAEDLEALDPRLRPAAESIARRGRQLDAALALVNEVKDRQHGDAEVLDRTRRSAEAALRQNRESAELVARANADLSVRERVVESRANDVTEAARLNMQNAAELQESTERNARTIRELDRAADGIAAAKGTLPDDEILN